MRFGIREAVQDDFAAMAEVVSRRFARLANEDAHVREVIDEHQDKMGAHMRLISQFMFWLAAMNAALLTSTAAIANIFIAAPRGDLHLTLGSSPG